MIYEGKMPETYEEYLDSDYVQYQLLMCERARSRGERWWWKPASRQDFERAKETNLLGYLDGRMGRKSDEERHFPNARISYEDFRRVFLDVWYCRPGKGEPPAAMIDSYYARLSHKPAKWHSERAKYLGTLDKFPSVGRWLGVE